MLKGHTKIELTNVKTGRKEVHEDTNMVTDAVKWFFKQYGLMKDNYQLNSSNGNGSPINNIFGGIVGFDTTIDTSDGNIFPPADAQPVVCGRQGFSTSLSNDESQGVYNADESSINANQKTAKFVYDYSTSKGNGTIKSICLCPYVVGLDGFGGAGNFSFDNTLELQLRCSNTYSANYNLKNWYENIIASDYANNKVYIAERIAGSPRTKDIVRIHVRKSPYSCIPLWYTSNNINSSEDIETHDYVIPYSYDYYSMNYSKIDKAFYFINRTDSNNNYIPKNSSFTITKINLETFESETITVKNNVGYDLYSVFCYISKEHLFARDTSNSRTAIININDDTEWKTNDTSLYLGEGVYGIERGENLYFVSNRISSSNSSQYIWFRYSFDENKFYRTRNTFYNGSAKLAAPDLKDPVVFSQNYKAQNSSGQYYYFPVIMRNFLSTINNLATPITKTSEQTMKITYTITQK